MKDQTGCSALLITFGKDWVSTVTKFLGHLWSLSGEAKGESYFVPCVSYTFVFLLDTLLVIKKM